MNDVRRPLLTPGQSSSVESSVTSTVRHGYTLVMEVSRAPG